MPRATGRAAPWCREMRAIHVSERRAAEPNGVQLGVAVAAERRARHSTRRLVVLCVCVDRQAADRSGGGERASSHAYRAPGATADLREPTAQAAGDITRTAKAQLGAG